MNNHLRGQLMRSLAFRVGWGGWGWGSKLPKLGSTQSGRDRSPNMGAPVPRLSVTDLEDVKWFAESVVRWPKAVGGTQ